MLSFVVTTKPRLGKVVGNRWFCIGLKRPAFKSGAFPRRLIVVSKFGDTATEAYRAWKEA